MKRTACAELKRQIAFALTVGVLVSLGSPARAANPIAPPTISGPITPPLSIEGTGLCMASASTTTPLNDFGFLNAASFNGGMNSFMEAHINDRVESVIRTILDLSNNNNTGLKLSYGDYIDSALPICQTGGCGFFVNDAITAFGARARGFLNVTTDMAGKPIHFGIFADDAVSLTFFDKDAHVQPALIRPPQLGVPTWRTTNTVTFMEPGLYPLEILYVEIAEHAALEMSYHMGTFNDFELPANTPGSTNLMSAGYTLFPATSFFQTLSGAPSFQDLDQCKQCDRQFVNQPGNSGCIPGYYCNEAALCAPCDTAVFCGPTCSPCGGDTPFCVNINGTLDCGGCRVDADCEVGFTCDLATHECNECNVNSDCPRGEICVDHSCEPCQANNACAGNSCNCCPKGANGQFMQCVPLETNGAPMCVECVLNSDCPKGLVCDAFTGHCLEELKSHTTNECCGEGCVRCPSDRPFCTSTPIDAVCAQCRQDMDCPTNTFCLSGECQSCTKDRRCGPRCESCGGDTPYCMGQKPESATCVRCTRDDQCAAGSCNPNTHECTPGCATACGPDTPYCDGKKCVQCYADTQCPCGHTCDFETNRCTPSCKTAADCLGNEHCRAIDDGEAKDCALGPFGDVACGGTLASYCEGSIGRKQGDAPSAVGVGLALVALLGRRRKRGRP